MSRIKRLVIEIDRFAVRQVPGMCLTTKCSVLLLALAGLVLVRSAVGQTTALVTGRVADTAENAVPNAQVEIRELATGIAVSVLTGEDGRYYLPNLRPGGPYTLTVSALGFADASRTGIRLRVGQVLRIDFELTEEPIELPAIEVEVMPDPVFDPSRMGAATLIEEEAVTRLPSLSRKFTDFAVLSPLVTIEEDRISIAGQNDRFNSIQIDGALSQDVFGLETGLPGGQANAKPIPLDAIKQYQVLVAPFDVRQSGFTGGVLNAVTRSGTNRWTGTAFGYYRDEALLGELTVDGVSRKPDELDNLLFGLTLGGPILRDRLHFFAAAEFEQRKRPPIGFNLGTDDPLRASLSPDSAQRLVEILADRFGVDPGEFRAVTLANDLANVFARFDYQINESHRMLLWHNFATARDEPGPNREPFDAYELSSYDTKVRSTTHSTVLQLLSRLSPRLSNEFRVNLQSTRDDSDPRVRYPRVEVDVTSELAGEELTRRVRAGADFYAHASELDQDIFQLANDLTLAVGGQRVLFGVSAEYFRIRRLFLPGSLGTYRFASLADLEANQPARYDINSPFPDISDPAVRFSVLQWAGYIQREESALNDRLNLRYGLRIDVPVILDQPRANPEFERVFGVSTTEMPSVDPLYSWRVGFNWRLGGKRRTQIRGGAGLFTGRPPFVWLSNAYANTGRETVFLSCTGDNAPGLDPSAPPPLECLDGTGPEVAGAPIVNIFDPDFKFPQDLKFSLAIDQDLPFGLVGSAGWLFAKAQQQIALEDINLGDQVPDPRHEDGYSDGFGNRTHFGTPTLEGFAPGRRSDAFGPVIRVTNSADNYLYALSFELRREFGDRASLLAGYSYSRSADTQSLTSSDATTNFGLNPVLGHPNEPPLRPAVFDRPHKVVLSAWTRLFERFGGTELTLLYVGQSGRPYSYVYFDDVNGDGYPGGGQLLDNTNDLIYVPTSLSDIPGTIGTRLLLERLVTRDDCLRQLRGGILGRNACRTPWTHRLDLRVAQTVRAGRGRVQVTFDVLNLLNLLNDDWGRVETTIDPTVPVLMLDGRLHPFRVDPSPQDPLMVRYSGPIRRGPAGEAVLGDLPYSLAVPGSQWQAQLGIRVAF